MDEKVQASLLLEADDRLDLLLEEVLVLLLGDLLGVWVPVRVGDGGGRDDWGGKLAC